MPRQARDKHRENSKTDYRFLADDPTFYDEPKPIDFTKVQETNETALFVLVSRNRNDHHDFDKVELEPRWDIERFGCVGARDNRFPRRTLTMKRQ